MLDVEFILFVLSIGVFMLGTIDFLTNYRQWRTIKNLQGVLNDKIGLWEERGDIGQQFGNFLMAREAQDKPTNLQIMATEVGQTLYASLRSGANAALSGDKRHENMVENKTLEALEASDPEMKVLKGIFERLGLDDMWNPDDIPSVVNVLRKHGVLGGGNGAIAPRGNSRSNSMVIE